MFSYSSRNRTEIHRNSISHAAIKPFCLRIGPFTSLGPLRNTPEAATVGLLCGCAVVGIASCLRLVSDSRQVLATCMIILVMNPSLACFGVDRSVSN